MNEYQYPNVGPIDFREEPMGNCLGCGVRVEDIIDDMLENKHGCFDDIDGCGKKTVCPRCGWCALCDETKEPVQIVIYFLTT